MTCRCCTPLCPCLPLGLCTQPSRAPIQKQEETQDETYCACRRDDRRRRDRRGRAERSDRRPQGADEGQQRQRQQSGEDDARRRHRTTRPRSMRRSPNGPRPRRSSRLCSPTIQRPVGTPERRRKSGKPEAISRRRSRRSARPWPTIATRPRISTRSKSPWPPWARPATAATSNIAPGSADCFNRLVFGRRTPGAAALSCLAASSGALATACVWLIAANGRIASMLYTWRRRRDGILGDSGRYFFHKYYPGRAGYT